MPGGRSNLWYGGLVKQATIIWPVVSCQTVGSTDAAVERTATYLQGELRSKRGCPGAQRVWQDTTGQMMVMILAYETDRFLNGCCVP